MCAIGEQAALLQREWQTNPRWTGITRDYSAHDVIRLRLGVARERDAARRDASRLWDLLRTKGAVPAISPAADQAPLVTDAEADLDGLPDAFELMTAMIEAGAAGVRFDDRLSPPTEAGHRAGKALVPTGQLIGTLTAARFAADVLGVPTLIIARTGAHTTSLLTSAADERDHEFLTGERTVDGFHRMRPGLYACVTRSLAFAPYADLLWLDTPAPDLGAARAFADIIRSQHPDKPLAYSCPSPLAGQEHPGETSVARFQRELAAMGYRFPPATGHPAAPESSSAPAGRPARDDAPAYA